MKPEVYVVRIYRRSHRRGFQLVGRLETPGGARHASFASFTELAAILSSPRARMTSAAEKGDVSCS